MKLPTFYIPHGGGPCFFIDTPPIGGPQWDALAGWLRSMVTDLPERPKAVLVVSAHWEEPVPTVLSSAKPPLLYDYYGFPDHTYALSWPAVGATSVASRVQQLLGAAGIDHGSSDERGLDHGVFIPLLLSLPEADIPTTQLSLKAGLDARQHLAIGRALEPLREEGVLIVGSGMSYHNMRGFMNPASLQHSEQFDKWMTDAVGKPQTEREDQLRHWLAAPMARAVHPREEHLLPLMVCAGAAGADAGQRVFSDVVMGVRLSSVRFG